MALESPSSSRSASAVLRVLIVEDEPTIARALDQLLGHYGFEARVARTLAEGMQLVNDWEPHAVLLDLWLPDGNGLHLLRHVRPPGAPTSPAMPRIAVLSGVLQDPHIARAVAALRPDRVFAKPVDFLDIRTWLDAATRPDAP